MAINEFSRCELRLKENPFHSLLSQPWGMVAIGGLMASLHRARCRECGTVALVRHYLVNNVAILWKDEGDGQKRKEFGASDSMTLAIQVMGALAIIHSGPHRLMDIQVGLPPWCKDFFVRSSEVLSLPLAAHKAFFNGNGVRVMGDCCPECQSELCNESDTADTTLVVTDDRSEIVLLPVPLVACLYD